MSPTNLAMNQVNEVSASAQKRNSAPLALDDVPNIVQLGAVLRERGYTDDGIREALDEEGTFEISCPADVQKYLQRLTEGTQLSTLIKLFLLGLAVSHEDAALSLAPLDLRELQAIGLLETTREGIQSPVRIVCNGGLALACDGYQEFTGLQFDHVAAAFESSMTLGCLTVRQPVKSALDVGAGSGILALVASMHSQHVTAVDINPRALNFTAFNGIMKGALNVECLQGNFFEPVKGRKFDLIVSNPPFIISPEYRVEFRDSQLPGDMVCKEIIRQIPDHLEEDGFAHVIFNWVHEQDGDWPAPVREWVESNGCDALLLRIGTKAPRAYATICNEDIKGDNPDAYQPTIERWVDYYEQHDIQAISYGVIILRRRSGGANWFLAESIPPGDILPSSDHILRIFEAQDYLSGLSSDLELLDGALMLIEDHRAEPKFVDKDGEFKIKGVQINMKDGLRLQCVIDPYTYRVLHRCDGHRKLGEIISGLARIWGLESDQLTRAVLPVLRQLMALGFLAREEAKS